MIIDGYKELYNNEYSADLNVVSYKDSDVSIFFMWHPPEYPSILPHWHERLEFIYIVDGSLSVNCGSFSGKAVPGDVIIANPNELHAANAEKQGVKYYAFLLGDKILKEIGVPAQNNKYILPLLDKKMQFCNFLHDEKINSVFESIIVEHSEKGYSYELAIQSYILLLFSLLNRYYIDTSAKNYILDTRFSKVIQYIGENFLSGITTEIVAKQFSYNKSHFCRKFKQQTGMTFVQYITLLRLELADSIIRSTSKPITEIAADAGFSDPNYFTRVYCKFYGMHPTDSRKKAALSERNHTAT